MLKKNRNEFESYPNQYELPTNNATSSDSSSQKEKTVIGELISIDGTVRAKEDLIIQGSLKGSMELEKNHAIIGPKGNVEADIAAENITICGKMNGNASVKGKVEITHEAEFVGQIKTKRIAIEDGAYVKATIEMVRDDDKRDKQQPTKRPMEAVVVNKKNEPTPAKTPVS